MLLMLLPALVTPLLVSLRLLQAQLRTHLTHFRSSVSVSGSSVSVSSSVSLNVSSLKPKSLPNQPSDVPASVGASFNPGENL